MLMNRLVLSGLTVAVSALPALATDNAWSSLDKEIDSLSASLSSADNTGPRLGGYVITSYRHSSDDLYTGGSGMPDQSGFQIDALRVELTGEVSDNYGYKISFDLGTGNGSGHGASPNGAGTLRDAYATWRIAEGIKGKLGRFKEPVLNSALASEVNLVFLDRTAIGDAFKVRDLGLALDGSFDVLGWTVAFQDGGDGQADEHKYTARLTATVVGTARDKIMEGAYGVGDATIVTVGASYQDDTSLDDGRVIAGEAALNFGRFSIAGEVADIDDGTGGAFGRTILLNDASNTTPWDVTATFAFTPEWELCARYEDTDDVDDTTSYRLGVDYFVHGHGLKWVAQWVHIDTDNAVGDSDQLGAGLTLAF
jgi:hypothetical protein